MILKLLRLSLKKIYYRKASLVESKVNLIENRLISVGLEPVVNHTEKSCKEYSMQTIFHE